eukprot:scaffold472_cov264-Pinguiococcus_pyrenoidosus.AAC.11
MAKVIDARQYVDRVRASADRSRGSLAHQAPQRQVAGGMAADYGEYLNVTKEDISWALGIVSSRSMGGAEAPSLVPLLDLLNHHRDAHPFTGHNGKSEAFALVEPLRARSSGPTSCAQGCRMQFESGPSSWRGGMVGNHGPIPAASPPRDHSLPPRIKQQVLSRKASTGPGGALTPRGKHRGNWIPVSALATPSKPVVLAVVTVSRRASLHRQDSFPSMHCQRRRGRLRASCEELQILDPTLAKMRLLDRHEVADTLPIGALSIVPLLDPRPCPHQLPSAVHLLPAASEVPPALASTSSSKRYPPPTTLAGVLARRKVSSVDGVHPVVSGLALHQLQGSSRQLDADSLRLVAIPLHVCHDSVRVERQVGLEVAKEAYVSPRSRTSRMRATIPHQHISGEESVVKMGTKRVAFLWDVAIRIALIWAPGQTGSRNVLPAADLEPGQQKVEERGHQPLTQSPPRHPHDAPLEVGHDAPLLAKAQPIEVAQTPAALLVLQLPQQKALLFLRDELRDHGQTFRHLRLRCRLRGPVHEGGKGGFGRFSWDFIRRVGGGIAFRQLLRPNGVGFLGSEGPTGGTA